VNNLISENKIKIMSLLQDLYCF